MRRDDNRMLSDEEYASDDLACNDDDRDSISPCEEVVIYKSSASILICSLDADGCFLPPLSKKPPHNTMAEHNSQFFEALLKRMGEIHEDTIILSGSARQSCLRDLAGMFQQDKKGHCFITDSYFFALKKFVDDINAKVPNCNQVTLDPFLLDDVCFDRPSGDTFKEAQKYGLEFSNLIQGVFNTEVFKEKIKEIRKRVATDAIEEMEKQKKARQELFFWESGNHFPLYEEHPGKFALLYAQVHHIASQFSIDAPLDFHFYDDRLDILWPLVSVFIHARELLPKNMTLHFHHYVGGKQQLNPNDNNAPVVKKIKGDGEVDLHYRKTLHDMMSQLPVEKVYVEGSELSMRFGNPLNHFFEIESRNDFDPHQFLASVLTVSTRDTFVRFNEDRLIRIGAIEEQSFTDFFSETRRQLSLVSPNDREKAFVQSFLSGTLHK